MARHGVQIVCIGTELLLGETINTNLAFLASSLNGVGLRVEREVCIPDEPAVMRAALAQAAAEAEAVITVGGLGPTSDDLTKELVAEVLGVPLTVDAAIVARIREMYAQRRIEPLHRACERQAQMPTGATPITNDWGTAPGVWWDRDGLIVVMLPGPPRELRPMFTANVLPLLAARLQPAEKRATLSVYGIPESTVEQRTMVALAAYPRVVPSYCTRWGSCLVRLTVPRADEDDLAPAAAAVISAFAPDARLGEVDLVEEIVDQLRRRGGTLVTAESCTGGGIGTRITDLAGVSDIFAGGFITYSNALKQQLLGVRAETLLSAGAVSEAAAREMVEGACQVSGASAGIAVTGIAGPGGGSPEKPVGTVWIATRLDGETRVTHHRYPYDRQGVRERTVSSALNQLRQQLLDHDTNPQ